MTELQHRKKKSRHLFQHSIFNTIDFMNKILKSLRDGRKWIGKEKRCGCKTIMMSNGYQKWLKIITRIHVIHSTIRRTFINAEIYVKRRRNTRRIRENRVRGFSLRILSITYPKTFCKPLARNDCCFCEKLHGIHTSSSELWRKRLWPGINQLFEQ